MGALDRMKLKDVFATSNAILNQERMIRLAQIVVQVFGECELGRLTDVASWVDNGWSVDGADVFTDFECSLINAMVK